MDNLYSKFGMEGCDDRDYVKFYVLFYYFTFIISTSKPLNNVVSINKRIKNNKSHLMILTFLWFKAQLKAGW